MDGVATRAEVTLRAALSETAHFAKAVTVLPPCALRGCPDEDMETPPHTWGEPFIFIFLFF